MIDEHVLSAEDFKSAAKGETVRIRKNGSEFVLLNASELHELEHRLNFMQLIFERKADIEAGRFYTHDEFWKLVKQDIEEIRGKHESL